MALRVYNTLTRQKELFEPVQPGRVTMYLCGPTVYKSPHIGHMVGPVIFDAIKRYLLFKGFDVNWVVNITDVDDKLIAAAAEAGTTVAELAERHTAEYFSCLKLLGVDTIDQFPKVTDYIPQIVQLCQTLVDKGFAYAVAGDGAGDAAGNLYFDVGKDSDYLKLSHRKLEEQEAGTRDLEGGPKRNRSDFALWKAAKPGEPAWDSPWGKGRPGWHIECSAMSLECLKTKTIDIHGGGMDLIFPHHENELAQSESATGQPFVKYWLHNGLTRLNTKKISGSDAATTEGKAALAAVSARKLIGDYSPELLRYFLLSTHYRSPIDFTDEVIMAARKGLEKFTRLFERIERLTGQPLPTKGLDMDIASRDLLETPMADFARSVLSFKMKFLEMMDDDFNTAGAIGVLHEMASEANAFIESSGLEKQPMPDKLEAATAAVQSLKNLAQILGLFRQPTQRPNQDNDLADKLMALLIQLRQDARVSKNFALADAVRKGLVEIGVTLEDRADGTGWRRD